MGLRGGLIGCGGFAVNHLHGWSEIAEARIVALCDRDADRAEWASETFRIERAFESAEEMLASTELDFIDVVTQPDTHRELVALGARHGVAVICQKPMAPSLDDARAMVEACREAGVAFMVHENFRWQPAMRKVRSMLDEIGPPFFGRISFRSAFDVYADQPYLAEDERFIIYDLGVHLLDLARFFMGDAARLYARTQGVNPRINGEDVATILLEMEGGGTCIADMSYASILEEELFPQTLVQVDGPRGSLSIGPHYAVTHVDSSGSVTRFDASPPSYDWSKTQTAAVQASVVAIQRHWVDCLRDGRPPETSGADNLRTLELVFGAYASAETGDAYVCTASNA